MTFLAHWEVPERTIFMSDSASHFNHHKHEQTKILKLEKVIYYARPCITDIMSSPSNHRSDISVRQLTYSHTPDTPPSLRNISIHLPPGSRTILCGANGGQCDPITFSC
jgi:ABC-type bacteriocin/lantibiotic exporter with double-glycine peptidase domain